MSDIALKVDGLSKRYRIGSNDSVLQAKRSAVMAARRLKRSLLGQPAPEVLRGSGPQEFWALKDVSFEVRHGETVGIIGRNGAGKSTLLKILSRITKPTRGRAEVHGRLGSLLEVGTGFHPELTGRENIFLNATILGLSKQEIISKFDEIVAFAEIEKFIDTPVKFYSSGMYMRLAFSVSAHLDPEILVLDEVLAVGDAAFQRKCMGRMEGVAKDGRTVLLVSHSIATIVSFCNRCILLQDGQVVKDGDAASVAEYYQEMQGGGVETDLKVREMIFTAEKNKNLKAAFRSLSVTPLGSDAQPASVLRVGSDLRVRVSVQANQRIDAASLTVSIFESNGHRVIDIGNALKGEYLTLDPGAVADLEFVLRNVLLKPGQYRVSAWLGRPPTEDIDVLSDAATFDVEVNPRQTKYPHQYFGVYQCEFTHSVSVTHSGSDEPA